MIDETIKHFKIISRLGSGGMGEVYLAEDNTLDRKVALKFLPSTMWNDEEAKARLIREAKSASRLDHPNIVTIHGIEDAEGRLFIVMSYVSGTTLDKFLATSQRSTDELIDLTLQILEGLQHAHKAGVVHRDLKPANILVDESGRIRILDFGLARIRGTSRVTQAGSTVGTLAYTPPELIHGHDAEPTSDIYSLGVVLFQMLTGRLPFEADHEAALLYSILNEEPQRPSSFNPSIAADLQKIVMRCLERRPESRFASCEELTVSLRSCRSEIAPNIAPEPKSDRSSIAVLPFVNRSSNPDDEYFSDGLADELLNMLVKIGGLRVAARASSFQFKGKAESLSTIGQRLNVSYVLDGSVRRAGDRVRISVQLIKAADGYHLWSETYDRRLDDIFAVQDDIAQSVVKELRATLLRREADSNTSRLLKAEVARAAIGRSTDAEAHRLWLLARHRLNRSTRPDITTAIEYLEEALTRDPAFAPAWTELSHAYMIEADRGWVPMAEGYLRAREAVDKAITLEPNLAEGQRLIGWIRMSYEWDWEGARSAFARALELEPGNATVLRSAGQLSSFLGRFDEAIMLYRQTLEQDPLSAPTYHNLGNTLHAADRFAEAEEAYGKVLELDPHRILTNAYLSFTLLALDRHKEALAAAMREPLAPPRLYALAIIHQTIGDKAKSDVELRELTERHANGAAFQIAQVHTVRGDFDLAFDWLERAYAMRDAGLASCKLSSRLRPLHNDPRWAVLMKKIGLET